MFYSTQILAKKGPLGTIWIAAHLDRRLKRHQVFEANIAISVGALTGRLVSGVLLRQLLIQFIDDGIVCCYECFAIVSMARCNYCDSKMSASFRAENRKSSTTYTGVLLTLFCVLQIPSSILKHPWL